MSEVDLRRSWLIAVDRYRGKPNGDRLTSKGEPFKLGWYEDHPDAWEVLEVVPRAAAEQLAQAISASLKPGQTGPLADALKAYLADYPWSDL